jgi:adenylate cyclase
MEDRAADIFISYARSSQQQAEQIAGKLRAEGYSVWWDDELPAHRTYSDVIQERLDAARAVLAIWSGDAAKSQWVRAEADFARSSGKLVQLNIDGTMPPIPFNQIDCPAIGAWSDHRTLRSWEKIKRSLSELVGPPAAAPSPIGNVGRDGKSICVLPFTNRSADPEQDYLSDGITEDLITALAQSTNLLVVARTTSFALKGVTLDAHALARQLNVDHILEGSVRKSGNRLRITAQLIDASTGLQLWTDRFDRELADAFEIQDDISGSIVQALQPKLDPCPGAKRHSPEPKAYQSYLKAKHFWNRGTEDALNQAVALFQEASDCDPAFARAQAGLADAWVALGMHTYVEPNHAYARAREAAAAALNLDPELADAHASLGLIAFVHRWDAVTAERHFVRALELGHVSITSARHHYSRLLSARARHEQAIEHAQAAVELDPLSLSATVQLAGVLRNARRFDESIDQLHKAQKLFPEQFPILYNLAFSLAYAGRPEEAVKAAEGAIRAAGRTMFSLGALGYAKARAGASDEAIAIAREMEAAAASRYVCPFDIAAIYAGLEDAEPALRWLKRGLEVRDHAMLFADVDPALDPLRHDRRFEALFGQVWADGPNSVFEA